MNNENEKIIKLLSGINAAQNRDDFRGFAPHRAQRRGNRSAAANF